MARKQTQWLQKYHPQKTADVVGNVRVVRALKEWMTAIQKYNEDPESMEERPVPIVFLYGPGGIGKTSVAQVLLQSFNYEIYELNSGEVRSKKRMQDILDKVLNNHSVSMMKKKDRQQTMGIIMDEIDGMSCGDKGGLHELFHIIEQQSDCTHPVICIGNRPYEKKIPASLYTEYQLRHPTEHDIKQRLQYICKQENVQLDDVGLLWIIKYCNLDVRRTIHFLQEVVYHCGNDRTKEITIEDIERVKNTTAPAKQDSNMFSVTQNVYQSEVSLQELRDIYKYDEAQITMMIYENLPTQLSQKKLDHHSSLAIHMNTLHNLCHLDALDGDSTTQGMVDAKSVLCCGFVNTQVAPLPTISSTPKRIQYTNILTKIANQSNVLAMFNDVSTRLRIHPCHLHCVIPILMKDIVQHPSHVLQYGLTVSHLEKLIQVYNKWAAEVSKSESEKVTKILARIKREWKACLKAPEREGGKVI